MHFTQIKITGFGFFHFNEPFLPSYLLILSTKHSTPLDSFPLMTDQGESGVTRGAHYIIGYPILTFISLYFCKLYYILYLSAYTIYSLDPHILKLYGKGQEST